MWLSFYGKPFVAVSMGLSLVKKSLANLLQEYRSLRPKLSLRSLSRNMGVNRYFLTKILDDNDKAKFSLDEMLIFCKFIKDNLPDSPQISRELAVVQDFFSEHLGSSRIKLIHQSEDPKIDLYDRFNFLVLVIACCDKGITRKRIIDILGEGASSSLKQLLKNKLLEELPNGAIRVLDGAPVFFSPALLAFHGPDLLRWYRLRSQEHIRNYLDIKVQSLTKEAIEKVIELQKDCDKKILDIIVNEENFGMNPMFALSCVETFVDEII